ncbi:MAG: sensor histidine kinase [Oscillospiraceae bacterium]
MTSKIFRSIMTTSIIVLAAALVIITGFLYSYFTSLEVKQLKDTLSVAAAAAEQSKEDYLGSLDSQSFRFTWIAADGSVLFDSAAEKSQMDNHLDREEIAQAFETGHGSSSRHSATLTVETLYEATLLSDGTVLRISTERAGVISLLLGMLTPVIAVIFIAAVLSAVLAYKMSKRITEPLNKIDLDNPMENEVYEEISPLLLRIHRQNMKIEQKADELNRSKEEFGLITSNMREGLVLLDRNRSVITINPSAMELFGVSSDCIGRDFLTVERRTEISHAVEAAARDGHSEVRIQRGDREYQFDISSIQSGGEIVGTVILCLDITEQAGAERMRREFSANVSHELKTPLQSISGSAELIENGLVKPEDMPRFVGHIREEAARLIRLVEDIIRLSQLDEGGEMPKEQVSLLALSKEVCGVIGDSASQRGITLNVSGADGTLTGIRQLLFEIIYNLCDNAVKYNRDNGRVDVIISETEKTVTLTVSDTGAGIPAEHQPRVFERFYRVDKSHSKKSGGTGLGLSIVKHGVMLHKGKITLKSEENKGTEITVVFPKTE